MGCYVPAAAAELAPVDRVFTRIGRAGWCPVLAHWATGTALPACSPAEALSATICRPLHRVQARRTASAEGSPPLLWRCWKPRRCWRTPPAPPWWCAAALHEALRLLLLRLLCTAVHGMGCSRWSVVEVLCAPCPKLRPLWCTFDATAGAGRAGAGHRNTRRARYRIRRGAAPGAGQALSVRS